VKLIVFSGLPATGKSSIAEAVARELGIPMFAKDRLAATLKRLGIGYGESGSSMLGQAGYELLATLAQQQLRLGQSAILDSVLSWGSTRRRWRKIATDHDAEWYVIECICSDKVLHRTLLAGRRYNIPGWQELAWTEVERVNAYYKPWDEDHLVLDAVDPLADNVQSALAYTNRSG
jgi:predicted kinase